MLKLFFASRLLRFNLCARFQDMVLNFHRRQLCVLPWIPVYKSYADEILSWKGLGIEPFTL